MDLLLHALFIEFVYHFLGIEKVLYHLMDGYIIFSSDEPKGKRKKHLQSQVSRLSFFLAFLSGL